VDDLSTQMELVAYELVPKGGIPVGSEDLAASSFGSTDLAVLEICWKLAVVFAEDHERHPKSAVARRFLDHH
jgi:hypothetical protein